MQAIWQAHFLCANGIEFALLAGSDSVPLSPREVISQSCNFFIIPPNVSALDSCWLGESLGGSELVSKMKRLKFLGYCLFIFKLFNQFLSHSPLWLFQLVGGRSIFINISGVPHNSIIHQLNFIEVGMLKLCAMCHDHTEFGCFWESFPENVDNFSSLPLE
jgi:hypothetical protein